MTRIQMMLVALLCTLALTATGTARDTEKPRAQKEIQEGIDAAELWLGLVDNKDYQASWDAAAPVFQEAVSKEEWDKTLSKLRTAMGPLKERRLFYERFTPVLPGLPDGHYIILQFATTFENKQNAVETVSLKRAADHDMPWQVAGYFIR